MALNVYENLFLGLGHGIASCWVSLLPHSGGHVLGRLWSLSDFRFWVRRRNGHDMGPGLPLLYSLSYWPLRSSDVTGREPDVGRRLHSV